jgi:nitrite reductase (NO-forming)
MKIVAGGAETQPGWLGPWYQFWESALKPFAPWSLGIWAIPEGFGNTSRVAYTDIGTSIINVTVFAALWALDSCTGPRRYSLDALIERRFPRWKRIAEVRDSEG